MPMKDWLSGNRRYIAFLLLFGVFRTAVADWNPIPSASMRPTILEGDVVFVNRLAYDLKLPFSDTILAHLGEPQRGDIVMVNGDKPDGHVYGAVEMTADGCVSVDGGHTDDHGRQCIVRRVKHWTRGMYGYWYDQAEDGGPSRRVTHVIDLERMVA